MPVLHIGDVRSGGALGLTVVSPYASYYTPGQAPMDMSKGYSQPSAPAPQPATSAPYYTPGQAPMDMSKGSSQPSAPMPQLSTAMYQPVYTKVRVPLPGRAPATATVQSRRMSQHGPIIHTVVNINVPPQVVQYIQAPSLMTAQKDAGAAAGGASTSIEVGPASSAGGTARKPAATGTPTKEEPSSPWGWIALVAGGLLAFGGKKTKPK